MCVPYGAPQICNRDKKHHQLEWNILDKFRDQLFFAYDIVENTSASSYLDPYSHNYHETQASNWCLNAAQMKLAETCSIAWIARTIPCD